MFREARSRTAADAKGAATGTDWTQSEVKATVDEYLAMLAEEVAGRHSRRSRVLRTEPAEVKARGELLTPIEAVLLVPMPASPLRLGRLTEVDRTCHR